MIIFWTFLLLSPRLSSGGYPSSNCCATGGYHYQPSDCCQNKYPFLPAPPGERPACAKNGATFCERIETYPTEVIRYLLYKWGRSYAPFIVSETNAEFVPPPEPVQGYGGGYDYQPAPTFYPNTVNYNYSYGAPPPANGYQPVQPAPIQPNQPHFLQPPLPEYEQQKASQPSHQYQAYQPQQAAGAAQPQGQPLNFQQAAAAVPLAQSYWWNHRRSDNQPAYPHLSQHRLRVKRQALETDQLCPARQQYLTPQAAMNKDGNWMYVVNMDDSRYVQQVRVEVCLSRDGPCSATCTVAPNYRATCKQQMIQKRLVALAGTGDRLMNDVFWFPGCCQCAITAA